MFFLNTIPADTLVFLIALAVGLFIGALVMSFQDFLSPGSNGIVFWPDPITITIGFSVLLAPLAAFLLVLRR